MDVDNQIRSEVQAALEMLGCLHHSHIGVIVNDGIVTLLGEVTEFSDRWTAEALVKHVGGVRAIANDIHVRIPIVGARNDSEIAEDAANALRSCGAMPHAHIQPVVSDGWVSLRGRLASHSEKHTAERAIRRLPGVKGVVNDIQVGPELSRASAA